MRIPVASQLARQWIAQLRDLHASLHANPEHWSAWRWHIHIKILTYLVRRYGADPALDAKRSAAEPSPSLTPLLGRRDAQFQRIRSRAEFGIILLRIAEINTCKQI